MPALRSFRAAEGVRPYDTSLRANATRGKRATRSSLAVRTLVWCTPCGCNPSFGRPKGLPYRNKPGFLRRGGAPVPFRGMPLPQKKTPAGAVRSPAGLCF